MRLLPLAGLLNQFSRVVRDLARSEKKIARLVILGSETTADRRILEGLKSPLTHLIRNAIDHGIETPAERLRAGKPEEATLTLSARRDGAILELALTDDGAGFDFDAIRRRALSQGLRSQEQLEHASEEDLSALPFIPGFSTRTVVSDLSGRGTGLDAVRTGVESLNGSVRVLSRPGEGSRFLLRLPLTIATSQVLLCQSAERLFAIPLNYVERSLDFDTSLGFQSEGRLCLEVDGEPVPFSDLGALLDKPSNSSNQVCLVLGDQSERHGFLIDALFGVREIVVKPFHESRLVTGASILPDGQICLLLQPTELFRRSRDRTISERPKPVRTKEPDLLKILLVEDSPTMMALERLSLEKAGYLVFPAHNGAEAWEMAQQGSFDAVVSDIEMPEMDGLELTRKLRGTASFKEIPILLITSLESEKHRRAGLDAGASVYLPKRAVEEGTLVEILERLL